MSGAAVAAHADDSDPRLARVEAAIAEHRSLYLRAVDAGHDGEAQHHEEQVDDLLGQVLAAAGPHRVRRDRRPAGPGRGPVMGIAERFAATAARPCKLARVIAELDVIDRALVREILDGPNPGSGGDSGPGRGWSDEAIAVNLTREGHPVSDSTVRAHRGQLCTCFR